MEYSIEKLKKQASSRIKQIIDQYCGGVQQELSEKTGVAKASISQYIHGRNAPNNITAKKLATPFGINPAWIMGFDVPMILQSAETGLETDEAIIVEKYRGLPEDHKKMLEKYLSFLHTSMENQKKD